jgi:hypothetical protein
MSQGLFGGGLFGQGLFGGGLFHRSPPAPPPPPPPQGGIVDFVYYDFMPDTARFRSGPAPQTESASSDYFGLCWFAFPLSTPYFGLDNFQFPVALAPPVSSTGSVDIAYYDFVVDRPYF